MAGLYSILYFITTCQADPPPGRKNLPFSQILVRKYVLFSGLKGDRRAAGVGAGLCPAIFMSIYPYILIPAMRSIASPITEFSTVQAIRKYPSPQAPKVSPGSTSTWASSSIRRVTCAEVIPVLRMLGKR